MSETNVAVIVQMVFKEGKGAEAVAALRPLIAAAEAEDGTLTYALHTERKSPDHIWFYERYADVDAFRAHGKDPKLQEVLGELGPLMAQPPALHQLTPVAAIGLA